MDVSVRTGQTRAPKDMLLVSVRHESLHGEHVCLLMEIVGKEESSKTVAHECETIVKHALLEAEGDAAERLDGALKELNGLLKGVLVSGAVRDIHMLIGIATKDGLLHVSHAGRSEAYLIRRGIASQVTEYTPGRPTPAFVHIASGKLEAGDLIVYSTQRLLRSLTPAQLARIAASRDTLIDVLERALEADSEHAALAAMSIGHAPDVPEESDAPRRDNREQPMERPAHRRRGQSASLLARIRDLLPTQAFMGGVGRNVKSGSGVSVTFLARVTSLPQIASAREWFLGLIRDLHHPQRKKRAHLLLLASAISVLIVLWAVVHLFTVSQRSKTRADLEQLVSQINGEMQTAENRRTIGDTDSANAILDKAAQEAKQVMDNQSGLFRQEAFNLLERIQSKKEEINNIVRVSPRLVANLSGKTANIQATGMIGLGDGEFVAYDKQSLYHVLLNTVEDPHRISEDTFIIDGASFSRFQSQAFLMTGNAVTEWTNGQGVSMKTDDPRGWMAGKAIAAYLRFLYVLSPENKQIYKYEHLTNRYGIPVEYNVNGDLAGAIDMTIDGSVYVLKEDGTILKLFRGESQPFVIRKAPTGLLKGATKIFKVADRNFYLLDPVHARIIMLSDGGTTGESSYVKQYMLQGDQIGTLQAIYVDPDEAHLYVMDEKRIYVVDLNTK